jgi:diadenosine tetraphosphate (Ap4A) HIT family hydrolase
MPASEVYLETRWCVLVATRDPAIRARAKIAADVLPGSGVIIPIAHRRSPFDLTPEEWNDTRELLLQGRAVLHQLYAPDGYTLGWNDQAGLHPHLHVLPRFDDEPCVNAGIRTGINVPDNRRPDPWARGRGRAWRGTSSKP